MFACVNLQATHSQPAMDTTYWRYDVTLSHIVASIVVFFFVLLLNYNLNITIPLIFLVACTECRCSLHGHMDAAVYVTSSAMCDELGRTSFFAFIVHPQPLRCSMHVCICMC